MLLFAAALAHGGELNFAPDRPGFGDSTAVTGVGHVVFELGLAADLRASTATVGTGGLVGRIGVDEGFELRVRLPDPFFDGDFGLGPAGIGAKVGGAVGDRWSSSVVGELLVDPDDGTVGGQLGGNVAVSFDRIGIWATGNAAGTDAISVFAGGGVGYGVAEGGVYVNAGHTFGGPTLVGVGGYVLPVEAVQLDLGLDVAIGGDEVAWLPLMGVAFGI